MYKEKVHFLGDLRIIGTIRDSSKRIHSYVLMDEHSHKFDIVNSQTVMNLLTKTQFVNAAIENNKIVNTECAMQRLPIFNEHMQVIGNFGITILGELVQNNKSVGYKILDTSGQIVNIKDNELLLLINKSKTGLINGKIVKKDKKQIISAIKKKYTIIEIVEDDNTKINKPVENKKKAYRYKQHRDKLYNSLIPDAIAWIFSPKKKLINSNWYHTEVDKYGKLGRAFDIGKETKIIYSEILKPNITLTDRDKALLQKLVKDTKKYKGVIRDYTGAQFFDELYVFAFCQFMCNDKDYTDNALKLLDSNMPINFSKIARLKKLGWACDSLLELEEKLTIEQSDKNKMSHDIMKKEFKYTDFSTAKGIAQLGFALHEKDKNTRFITEAGFHKTLKYIGDFIPNYAIYKQRARCLGDLLVIADIEKLLDCMKYEASEVNNIYQDYYAIPGIIETLIVISYIYGSEAVRTYVDDNRERIYKVLNNMENFEDLPDFNTLAHDYFKLPSSIEVYFKSGFNVFLNDSIESKGGENYRGYSKAYLSEAKYINYRQLGNRRKIQHSYLRNNLCNVVKHYVSCDPEIVEDNIGKLRFL